MKYFRRLFDYNEKESILRTKSNKTWYYDVQVLINGNEFKKENKIGRWKGNVFATWNLRRLIPYEIEYENWITVNLLKWINKLIICSHHCFDYYSWTYTFQNNNNNNKKMWWKTPVAGLIKCNWSIHRMNHFISSKVVKTFTDYKDVIKVFFLSFCLIETSTDLITVTRYFIMPA